MQDTEHSGGQIEFAWSYHSVTNESIVLEIMLIAWAEMIGTKAIIAIKHGDGTWKIDTYNVTKETRNGCSLLPSKIAFVTNMSVEQKVANRNTMYATLVLPSEVYNVTKLNHVWQVGYDIEDGHPLGHPTTLRNVDSTEVIDLTDNGRSTGQYRSYLRSVRDNLIFLLLFFD